MEPACYGRLPTGVSVSISFPSSIHCLPCYCWSGLAACYLLLGLWQKHSVQQISLAHASALGHKAERLLVKPTLGNLWLWRSVYQHQDRYFINAVRLNPLTGKVTIFSGDSVNRFRISNNELGIASGSILQQDIERFAHFSDHYLALHPDENRVLFDVRYSNLPNSPLPLWGIRLDTRYPERHARYETFRDTSAETRQAFFDMLLGRNSVSL